MNPCSDEADEIEFNESDAIDDDGSEPQLFCEDEAAMEPLEIDWYPANSRNRHHAAQ